MAIYFIKKVCAACIFFKLWQDFKNSGLTIGIFSSTALSYFGPLGKEQTRWVFSLVRSSLQLAPILSSNSCKASISASLLN